MNIFKYIAFLLLFSPAVIAAPEIKGNPDELRGFLHPNASIVSLSARAEEKAYTDKAIVSVVVTTEDELLSEAISNNSALRDTIRQTLITKGIAREAINSAKFSSSPQYGWFGKKPDSYKVVNRMAIAITDEQHLKAIAEIADNSDSVVLSQTAFEHTQKEAYDDKVKAKALQKVLKQKAYYEQVLGIKLKPVGIRENQVFQQPTQGARRHVAELVPASKVRLAESYNAQPAPAASFDEVKYEANVSVDFKIEE